MHIFPVHCDCVYIVILKDHLVCYMGGSLALAAHNGMPEQFMEMGKQLTETCWEMYRRMPTGLSPEIVYFNTVPGSREDLFVKVEDIAKYLFYLLTWL
jgi:endoplasmic reticulum Man9GlcNAc2 1,2-alpha-mannosidase